MMKQVNWTCTARGHTNVRYFIFSFQPSASLKYAIMVIIGYLCNNEVIMGLGNVVIMGLTLCITCKWDQTYPAAMSNICKLGRSIMNNKETHYYPL